MKVKRWFCGKGHSFIFGNASWHFDRNQGFLEDGSPVPMYCTEVISFDEADEEAGIEEGEPCMDSSSLVWEAL